MVVSAWLATGSGRRGDDLQVLSRFHCAIDTAMTSSIRLQSDETKRSAELFIGVLAHEVRSPLSAIVMCTQHLLSDPARREKAQQQILRSAKRIENLIEGTADFVRGRAGLAMPLKRVAGDLQLHMTKIVTETQTRFPERDIRLVCQGDFRGAWDEARTGQLLSNLLSNAVQYGSESSPVVVTMRGDADGAGPVWIAVHNVGAPIPTGEQARIFEPLTRGTVHSGKAPQGLGLGLYICREIVRSHGGTLSVSSSARDGTQIEISLPRNLAGQEELARQH